MDFIPETKTAGEYTVPTIPKGVVGSLLAYVEARGVLLSIEAQEALQQVLRSFILAILGAIATFTGWLLLNGVIVGLLVENLHWTWQKSAAITAGGNLLVALISFLLVARIVSSTRWFADTFNELTKDRAWLARQTETH